MTPVFLPLGDTALTIEFSREIDAAVNNKVLALDKMLQELDVKGLIECVPTYRSLMVLFDPISFDLAAFKALVLRLCENLTISDKPAKRWSIPVVYGGEFGIDLEDVADFHHILPNEVIRLHSEAVYRVYMIGFLPGYAYLGGLSEKIHTPRRVSPRLKTPAGTISIGGIQACVASVEAPSGWHLLGQTPFKNYDPKRAQTFLLEAGDEVVFQPIEASRFYQLSRASEAGDYLGELI